MRKWGALAAVVGTFFIGQDARAQASYKVVVNPENRISSVTKPQLATFFLDRTTWDDGQPVTAIDLLPASPVREAFSRDVLSMAVASVVAKWRTSSGFGRGDPPPSVATDREVLEFVKRKPGAIGYVSASTESQGVKVLAIGNADPSAGSQIVEVGGAIPMPEKVMGSAPIYPAAAKLGHIQGQVEVEVVIGKSGNVEQTRVTRSVPIFDESAIAAVKTWKYKPTLINGAPIPVKAKVRVAFTL
jgi:TonB family protein